MLNLHHLLDMGALRRDLERTLQHLGTPARSSRRRTHFPHVNVHEASDAFEVEALVPGVAPESLDVTLKGDLLTLSGERAVPQVERRSYHRRERAHGGFSRTIRLASEVDPEKVEASYQDGILRVRLSKPEQSRPRQISVTVS